MKTFHQFLTICEAIYDRDQPSDVGLAVGKIGKSILFDSNRLIWDLSKSSPTTETKQQLVLNFDAARPIYVAHPPKIFPVLMLGVSMESYAIVPKTNSLLFIKQK